jgi:hypothetical protein
VQLSVTATSFWPSAKSGMSRRIQTATTSHFERRPVTILASAAIDAR